jgi:hypothetical protein
MIFAGVGVFCAPVDWIFQYLGRPKVIITKSEYIGRARGLAQRAKEIKVRRAAVHSAILITASNGAAFFLSHQALCSCACIAGMLVSCAKPASCCITCRTWLLC